jgi:hypothetical protein
MPYDTLAWFVRAGAIRPKLRMVRGRKAGCFSRDEVLQAAVMARLQKWLGGYLPRPLRQAVTKAFRAKERATWLRLSAAGATWLTPTGGVLSEPWPVIAVDVDVERIGLDVELRLLKSDPGRAAKRRDRRRP